MGEDNAQVIMSLPSFSRLTVYFTQPIRINFAFVVFACLFSSRKMFFFHLAGRVVKRVRDARAGPSGE